MPCRAGLLAPGRCSGSPATPARSLRGSCEARSEECTAPTGPPAAPRPAEQTASPPPRLSSPNCEKAITYVSRSDSMTSSNRHPSYIQQNWFSPRHVAAHYTSGPASLTLTSTPSYCMCTQSLFGKRRLTRKHPRCRSPRAVPSRPRLRSNELRATREL